MSAHVMRDTLEMGSYAVVSYTSVCIAYKPVHILCMLSISRGIRERVVVVIEE